jgi:hypothetical protein
MAKNLTLISERVDDIPSPPILSEANHAGAPAAALWPLTSHDPCGARHPGDSHRRSSRGGQIGAAAEVVGICHECPTQLSLAHVVRAYRSDYLVERVIGRLKGLPLSLTPCI